MAEGGSYSLAQADASTGGGEAAAAKPKQEVWEAFYNWACCVCVVTFDLELGQALEVGKAFLTMYFMYGFSFY